MKHYIKCKDWPIQPNLHVDFNTIIRIGEILTYRKSTDSYTTNYDHGSKEIFKELVTYYPECFVCLDQEDIDKLKLHPNSELVKHHYSGDYKGLYIGDAFIHD